MTEYILIEKVLSRRPVLSIGPSSLRPLLYMVSDRIAIDNLMFRGY